MLPLVVIPYITRVVGPENYGMIEFATVAMLYFIVLVNYGFATTATRKIAQADHDWNKVSHIFSSVLVTKLFLFLVAAVLFLVTFFAIPKFNENKHLMLFAFPIVLGWALFPNFLFQGLQKLQVIAIANFVVKLFAAILIILLLNNADQYYFVLGINSVAQISVGLFTLIYAFKSLPELRFKWPSLKSVKASLHFSRYVFVSQLFQRLFSFGSVIILGFLLTEFELGIFTASMKLIVVSISFLFLPLHGALFPYLAKLINEDRTRFITIYKKAILVMLAISGFSSIVLYTFPEFFIGLVFGEAFITAVPFVRVMAPIIFLNTLTHFGLNQGVLVLKRDGVYLRIIVTGAIFTVVLNLLFVPSYGLIGASVVKLGIEAIIGFLALILFFREFNKFALKPQKN